jgi:hypothetical protein
LHPSEWNKRGRVRIIDFCCKPGFGKRVIAHFIQSPPTGRRRSTLAEQKEENHEVQSGLAEYSARLPKVAGKIVNMGDYML